MIILSAWDTELDAREAERAARQVVTALPTAPEGTNLVERSSSSVLVALGVPPGKGPHVVEEVLRTWRVAPVPKASRAEAVHPAPR